jgi:glyoxylase-like metal-dependent hydrolase (beta-lactamase superfamily II)
LIFKHDGNLQIHQNLINADINPMEVTKVLLSHLHKDHAGGAGVENTILHQYHTSFPNAHYYVQKKELEFAFQKGLPSFIPKELEVFHHMDKLVLLEGDGVIDNYIRYEWSGGHSPFHQVFWITEGDNNIFFGGDEAPQLQQMKNKFVAKYDFDGKKAMELRQKWWKEGNEQGWTFLFYHDIKTPMLKIAINTTCRKFFYLPSLQASSILPRLRELKNPSIAFPIASTLCSCST